ncbi:hypothetical protein H5410_003684 [Solanum commersonii]|uniref:Uncharacterized protein n=1 Tax=Solanum commersonii TaxID=4109 RepID=A0A9J6B6B4_SOLCO|nr:hypothetical protein H5410_003684 [Solanum commersonii]
MESGLKSTRGLSEWINDSNSPCRSRRKLKGEGPFNHFKVSSYGMNLKLCTSFSFCLSVFASTLRSNGVMSEYPGIDNNCGSRSSSSDNMGIDSTHITFTECEREEVVGSRTTIHTPET